MLSSTSSYRYLVAGALCLSAATSVLAQDDVILWHNRYHAILAMAAYGDYNTLCPTQTFTEAAKLKNFPDSTLPAWEILETFGPTEHGAEGFTVLIPEMDKVVLVFKGDYTLEKTLPADVVSFDAIGLGEICPGCTVNNYAAQGYLEAVAATNNFEKARAKWEETGLWWSVTGHGLGGMHSIISSLVMGQQNITKFTHSYGAPRTLNKAGADLYNFMFGGDMTERGITNSDAFIQLFPQSDNYYFTNTAFYYTGYNETYKMNMDTCYEQPESEYCMPAEPLNEVDHYFAFSNVGQCGGKDRQDTSIAEAFIAAQAGKPAATATGSSPAPTFSILIGNATNPGPYTGGNAASSGAASSTVTTSSPSGTLTGTVSAVSSGSATSTGVAGVGANAAGVSSEASGVAAAENASSSSASTTPTGAAVSGVAGLSPVLVSAMACGAALLSVVAV